MYWFTLTSLLHKNIAQRRFVKCLCSGKCKIGGLNTDLQNIHIKTVTGLTGPDGAGSIAYPDGFTMLNAHILSAKIRFTNSEYYVFPYINADMFSDRVYIYFQYGENKISFNFGKNFVNTTFEVVLSKFDV